MEDHIIRMSGKELVHMSYNGRDEQVRRAVFTYVKANQNARRDEIESTLGANPELAISPPEITRALKDLEAEGVVFQLSSDPIDGDRFATVD